MKRGTTRRIEPYAAGAVVTLVWQLIFTKVLVGLDMRTSLVVSVVSGIMFFAVAVLVLESSALKGKL